jgi:hypothetical protein
MSLEAAVAIISGLAAESLTLTAFGVDSLIKLASAVVLLSRLNVELRRGVRFAQEAERTASRIAVALLVALAAYVVPSAGWKFWTRQGAEFSLPGLIVAVLAVRSAIACRKASFGSSKGSVAERFAPTQFRA